LNKKLFYANLDKFSKILLDNATNLQAFLFNSTIYVEGIRKSVSQVENYCKKGSRILDLGCGTGFLSTELSSLGFYVEGIDVEADNPEMIKEFKKRRGLQTEIWKALENSNTRFKFYDGIKIPYSDQSFDAVVAHAVIEHISVDNIDKTFQEIQRVLKPGGYFFIFRTPRKQALMEYVARILGIGSPHVLMEEQGIISMLNTNNFEVVSFQKTDMVLGFLPGKLQDVWNFLSHDLLIIDKLLLKTPLSYLAHHMQILCRKREETTKSLL